MQNRVSLRMMQNEYLFQGNAIYINFRAIFCKISCNMVLNTVQYGAKRSAF